MARRHKYLKSPTDATSDGFTLKEQVSLSNLRRQSQPVRIRVPPDLSARGPLAAVVSSTCLVQRRTEPSH